MKDGELFGTTQAGDAVRRFTIRGGGLSANIIGWGAIIQDLRLVEHDAGLDVSVKETAVCIVDEGGRIYREMTAASHPSCQQRQVKGRSRVEHVFAE